MLAIKTLGPTLRQSGIVDGLTLVRKARHGKHQIARDDGGEGEDAGYDVCGIFVFENSSGYVGEKRGLEGAGGCGESKQG